MRGTPHLRDAGHNALSGEPLTRCNMRGCTTSPADDLPYDIEPGVSFDGGDTDVQIFSLTAGLRFEL